MQRNIKSLTGCTLGAIDGEIGKVKEFYFDDDSWTVRYMVVETGSWLSGRKVLISPESLMKPEWDAKVFPVNLTIEQVKNSPFIDTDKPVSRQQEIELYQHYTRSNYWEGGLLSGNIGIWGMPMPMTVPTVQAIQNDQMPGQTQQGDSHLRSTDTVTGYSIHASDGEIGDVEDFIIDDSSWKITFMVVDTGNWFPGKKVLISPIWIKEVKWDSSTVVVDASTHSVRNSPEFDPDQPVSEAYGENLYRHYRKSYA